MNREHWRNSDRRRCFPILEIFCVPAGTPKFARPSEFRQDALLVPQRAVSELQGGYQVAVVDGENKVNIRTVTVGDRVGTDWIISDGLKRGERVVAEGVQKVRPGMQVNPKPFAAGGEGKVSPMSKFFINRPIVAMVISIVLVLVGAITILNLPVAQFPNIAPPEIQILATYVGADAQTLEQAVATPIEQQMSGVDNMNYMYSLNATGNSTTSLIVNFDVKTDPNTDFILTQARETQAASQLPAGSQQLRNHGPKVGNRSSHVDCRCTRRMEPTTPSFWRTTRTSISTIRSSVRQASATFRYSVRANTRCGCG